MTTGGLPASHPHIHGVLGVEMMGMLLSQQEEISRIFLLFQGEKHQLVVLIIYAFFVCFLYVP